MQVIAHIEIEAIANADASHSDIVWRSSFLEDSSFCAADFDLDFSCVCRAHESTFLLLDSSAMNVSPSVLSVL